MKLGDLFEEKISRKRISECDSVSFVGMQDVDENATIINTTLLPFGQVKSGFTYFEKGDVLVAKITPCFENGKGGLASKISTAIGFGSTEFHVLRAKAGVDPRYIYFQTKRQKFRNELEGEMVGSAGHRRVPMSAILSYELEVEHSFDEQVKISDALEDIEKLISSQKELITKKQAIRTGAMQQLLTGKKRLPGFGEGKGLQLTEIGEIPEDWDDLEVGKLLKIRHGKSQHEVEDINGAYPIMATGGQIGKASIPLYSKPSVLIGRKGTIDKPMYLDKPFWTVDTLFYSEINKHFDAKFIYYNFLLIDWYRYNEASGVPSLNASSIEAICIPVPKTKSEQSEIANVLSCMDEDIQELTLKLKKTHQLKEGMMQQLLTGKIRLV